MDTIIQLQEEITRLQAELKNANGAHDISVERFMEKSRQLEALREDHEVDMVGLAQYIIDKYISDETLMKQQMIEVRATEVVREYLYS